MSAYMVVYMDSWLKKYLKVFQHAKTCSLVDIYRQILQCYSFHFYFFSVCVLQEILLFLSHFIGMPKTAFLLTVETGNNRQQMMFL